MKSLTTKLMLSALGIVLVATPAFAHRPHRQVQEDYNMTQPAPEHYPNGEVRSGSARSVQSGAEFNLSY